MFPLGTGWHWPELTQLFQQLQRGPDGNPHRARPGKEVISFPNSAENLLPWGQAVWEAWRAGGLCGGSYSFHILLTDNSFETNQILNKQKQVICLSGCSCIQTRTRKNCALQNVSTYPVLTGSLHQPTSPPR